MMKSEKNALLSTVSLRSLAITGVALASLTLVAACGSVGGAMSEQNCLRRRGGSRSVCG